jgi:hypothetical protein
MKKKNFSENDVDYGFRDYMASRMKPLLDFQYGNTFGFEAPACRVVLNPDLGFERKLGNRKAEPLCLLEFKTPLLKSSIFKRSCQNRLHP